MCLCWFCMHVYVVVSPHLLGYRHKWAAVMIDEQHDQTCPPPKGSLCLLSPPWLSERQAETRSGNHAFQSNFVRWMKLITVLDKSIQN